MAHQRRVKPIWALAIMLALVTFLPVANVSAQTPAPDVEINEALPYRNIIETGDLFFLIRANLPLDGWCSELEVTTGCPDQPEQPWTIDSSRVQFAVYTGCTLTGTDLDCSGGTLQQSGNVARIGNLLGSAYLGPGHSITWGQAGMGVCVETLGSTWSSQTDDCLIPLWNSTPSDTESQLDRLSDDMITMMRNLELAALYPENSLINQDSQISKTGFVFATEALDVIDRIIPDRFQTGVGGSAPAFATPTGEGNLQAEIDATAEASGLTDALDNAGKNAFGMSGPTIALLGVIAVGMFFGALIGTVTKEPLLVTQPIIGAMGVGIYMRAPTVATLFGVIVVMAFMAAWWVAMKMRQ